MLSLVLSGLLWVGGLVDSLERPSVLDSLSLRQLELAALAADALPKGIRPVLAGEAPRRELQEELERQLAEAEEPPRAVRRLELALLERSGGSPAELRDETDLRSC